MAGKSLKAACVAATLMTAWTETEARAQYYSGPDLTPIPLTVTGRATLTSALSHVHFLYNSNTCAGIAKTQGAIRMDDNMFAAGINDKFSLEIPVWAGTSPTGNTALNAMFVGLYAPGQVSIGMPGGHATQILADEAAWEEVMTGWFGSLP